MDEWLSFLNKVYDYLNKIGTDFPLFRGHNDISWNLEPSLYRVASLLDTDQLESTLFQDFKTNYGPLYQRKLNSWEILMEMRQAGLPTRLLDWTENFASALFFALRDVDWKEPDNELRPCIWILNPYKLNKKFTKREGIPGVDNLDFEYNELIGNDEVMLKAKITGPIVVLTPRAQNRVLAQRSVFSLHAASFEPIEKMYKYSVRRFNIPMHSIEHAKKFLFLSGTNEYSQFPDLDGLGRYLNEIHGIKY